MNMFIFKFKEIFFPSFQSFPTVLNLAAVMEYSLLNNQYYNKEQAIVRLTYTQNNLISNTTSQFSNGP